MDENSTDQIAEILAEAAPGQPPDFERLIPLVYDDLRALAAKYLRRERPDHSLQSAGLVHKAFLKLVNQTKVNWQGRTHFFAVSAKVMRRILVDHARAKQRQKRGGGGHRIALNDDLRISSQRDERFQTAIELEHALSECGCVNQWTRQDAKSWWQGLERIESAAADRTMIRDAFARELR